MENVYVINPSAGGSGGTVTVSGTVTVDGSGHTQPVSGTVTADTELPAAAALTDSASNPTTPLVGCTLMMWNGATWERVRVSTTQKDLNGVTITSITTVWTPASGKKVRLMGGTINMSVAASVLFEDNGAGTTVFRTPKLLADTPYSFVVKGGQGYLLGTADNVLKATSSAAGAVTGTLWGTEE